jgi:CheY-like chemotaxis protein
VVSAESTPVIRVLFAEDAFDQALLVRAFLQSAPGSYQVTHSQDGDHAAQLVRDQEWELLITDLNLPGIDGFELCRIATSVRPALPILAITGYTGTQYQEEAFRAGASELLTKPLDKAEFVRKVTELTGQGGEGVDSPAEGAAQPPGSAPRATEPGAPTTPTPPSPARGASKAILAVGGLVGDVEMGCAGTLLKYRQSGADVVILPLCPDEADETGAGLDAALEAARRIGARLTLDAAAMRNTEGRVELVRRVTQELKPNVAFLPAMDDHHPSRREAFRIAEAAFTSVPLVLAYQTATTGFDFQPTRAEEVADQMMDKLEALTAYRGAGPGRLDLTPRMAQAYARYWGRLHDFTEVEVFEVIRG